MPAPDVPIERITGPAPLKAAVGLLENEGDLIRIGVPDLGSVEVSAIGIRVIAPDNDQIEKTWCALGAWASAQWLMTRGLCAMRGTVVAKRDSALVLLGGSRVGVSVTAAQLTRHGWGIVSDGLVVIDVDGSALSIETKGPTVCIDSIVAERLFADMPSRQISSTPDRKEIILPGHGDARVAYYVGIASRESATGISVTRNVFPLDEPERPPANLRWSPFLKVSKNTEPPIAPSFAAVRPVPRTMEDGPRIGPPAMALAIVDAIKSLEVVG